MADGMTRIDRQEIEAYIGILDDSDLRSIDDFLTYLGPQFSGTTADMIEIVEAEMRDRNLTPADPADMTSGESDEIP